MRLGQRLLVVAAAAAAVLAAPARLAAATAAAARVAGLVAPGRGAARGAALEQAARRRDPDRPRLPRASAAAAPGNLRDQVRPEVAPLDSSSRAALPPPRFKQACSNRLAVRGSESRATRGMRVPVRCVSRSTGSGPTRTVLCAVKVNERSTQYLKLQSHTHAQTTQLPPVVIPEGAHPDLIKRPLAKKSGVAPPKRLARDM